MSPSSAPPVSLPMVKQDIAADLAALPALRQWAEQACRDAGLDEAASYRLILAVDEIATNIVTHGYAEAGLSGDIALTIERTDRTLTVILEDGGVAYDPRTRSMPTALDLPKIATVLIETPVPDVPYGVRGVAEMPIVPVAAAVGNAIRRAIGVRLTEMPMTPERVLGAIKRARSAN